MPRRLLRSLLLGVVILALAEPARAHPTPFSYLDLHLGANGVTGTLVVHVYDAAYELEVSSPESLLVPDAAADRADLIGLLAPRLTLLVDDLVAQVQWGGIDTLLERQSLRLHFTVPGRRPTRLQVHGSFFPYDPAHQTFLNVYEDGALASQAIIDARRDRADYYSGTLQGRWAVVRTFVLSGVEHILIGPDHVLFLVGLLLLGGSLTRLALIVTAFTIGHSITLSLAALNIFSPPSRLVEPLIALTIIVVGVDNLLVLRGSLAARGESRAAPETDLFRQLFVAESRNIPDIASIQRLDLTKNLSFPARPDFHHGLLAAGHQASDIRAFLAASFGLIHGFGFASVLKEFGLPQAALVWSLFAFNLGVEVGQLFIVGVVAGSLTLLRRRKPAWGNPVARAGSIAVILAGLYWFVERAFFPGGSL